mmetsp:Transcript_20960/g.44231  ORF Transcript_20960/g.44231 Transcript_20960/m.44231 type:complete len:366 (+) Transcript_20960:237-1334(+)|eukprot:CAMPEP_0168187426 /NCGR_PEP_ID=MMETSP0139_2-20121125/15022_1 /TAXON_ID=44445 /ORGANISM="Pseudo-nitzschia australis, Strain 10249 10 AB" /LENGTH=365 /DNA_ID=CAMNT_0008109625 /DNA_START=128 /DNA_END=1225 /DNA_ORIENTATION=+
MQFSTTATLFAIAASGVSAFAPSSFRQQPMTTKIYNSVEVLVEAPAEEVAQVEVVKVEAEKEDYKGPLTAELINSRLEEQLAKMRLKDQTSKQLEKEDLIIIHEDKNILVIDKPSGVLTVPGKNDNPSLAATVHENVRNSLPTGDHMVVHRLGMDTSGLIIMAKNKNAVRELNGVFRSRKVDRRYEALVAGHVEKDAGIINLPVMRDYRCPPYVRISTDDHQWALVNLKPEDVGKKILEAPKESITKYEVVSREFLQGFPVTRVTLTSITGRYHQINVHLAAFGHPIIGDNVYGINGEALPNGGLTPAELNELIPNPNRADDETQLLLNESVNAKKLPPSIHAKYIKFTHPITKKEYEFSTDSPF